MVDCTGWEVVVKKRVWIEASQRDMWVGVKLIRVSSRGWDKRRVKCFGQREFWRFGTFPKLG